MKNTLRKLQINKVALVDAGAGKGVPVQLFKRRTAEGSNMTQVKKMELSELLAMVSALPEDQKAQVLAALGKAAEPTEEEKALKAAEEEKEAAVAKARSELSEELRKRDERIAKLERDSLASALSARVEKSMRGLVGKRDEIVAELLSIPDEKVRESVAKRYEETSAARVADLTKSGLLREIGSSLDGGGSDPAKEFDELVAKAMTDEKIKRRSDAITTVAKRRPDLWAQAQAKKEGAA